MSTSSAEASRVAVGEGIELNVRVWGGAENRAATAFLLVHGLSSNARLWDGVGAALAARGHRAVAVDQRGHGLSSKPEVGYDFPTLSRDLVEVARQTELTRPVVVGQSWGANVVLDFAVEHPDETCGVVAIDGATGDLGDRFPTWEACAQTLAPPALEGVPFERMEAGARRRHPDWPESGFAGALACYEVRADGTIAPWLTRDRHMMILRELWAHRPTELYPRLRVGAVIAPCIPADAVGQASARVRSKRAAVARIAALNRGLRVHWFEADHDVHAQHPDAVAQLLLDHVENGFFA
jgi:pimeloyl-ACP methyl ester carboxylesterase